MLGTGLLTILGPPTLLAPVSGNGSTPGEANCGDLGLLALLGSSQILKLGCQSEKPCLPVLAPSHRALLRDFAQGVGVGRWLQRRVPNLLTKELPLFATGWRSTIKNSAAVEKGREDGQVY